jgi:hypothetical protein
MLRPQGIIEEKSATMVSVCVRNIRANLDPIGKARFPPPLFTLPATEAPLLPGRKVAESRAFPRLANFFTKNAFPLESFCFKQPVILFTNPRPGRNKACMRAVLNH